MKRSVVYLTGTRADFGLMRSTLVAIDQSPALDLGLIVTGTHLSHDFGFSIDEIRASGLVVLHEIPVPLEPRTGLTMASAIGKQVPAIAEALDSSEPDIVLLLGDRAEMLAGAIAAVLTGTLIVHIHGGERSGSVDESFRHAISKLAHFHFVATTESANRLASMGEEVDRIFLVGAPGLDGIVEAASLSRESVMKTAGLDCSREFGLVLYHPVVQEQGLLGEHMESIITALQETGLQAVIFRSNSDAGGNEIERIIDRLAPQPDLSVITHVERNTYLSLLRNASVMVGNSSSGIIEAASFSTPVVDVGSRQNLRERGENVVNVTCDVASIKKGIRQICAKKLQGQKNLYGDGQASKRIRDLLCRIDLDKKILEKINAY